MENSQSEETFLFRGEIYNDEGAVPITIEGKYSKYGFDPVSCRILPDQDMLIGKFFTKKDGITRVQIRGEKYHDQHIWIPSLSLSGSLSGTAELFVIGNLNDLQEPRAVAHCYLTLPYTALMTLEADFQHENHEIKNWREDEPTGITWNTPLGKAELVRSYNYHSDVMGADSVRIETLECNIKIDIEPHLFTSIHDLIYKLWHSQDEITWLLSLLSRKRLLWYRASIIYEPVPTSTDHLRFIHLRQDTHSSLTRTQLEKRDHPAELLIEYRSLRNGVFERMVAEYEASPHRELILRAIQNLMATYDDFYFEAHYGIVWTALEMLVDGLGRDISKILKDKQFSSLKAKIVELLETELAGNPQAIEDVKIKLTELQRVAFVRKLIILLERYEIDYKQLWPKSVEDITKEIEKFHSRRNKYVHRGIIEDFFLNLQDTHRIRYLVSLLILKLLKYPVSELEKQHDSDLWYAQRLKEDLDF